MKIHKEWWEHFGQAGHFCAADWCRFHLHTHVGKWCVSTVGDYHPPHKSTPGPEEIGCERLFETMVFEIRGDGINPSELDMRSYNDRDAANIGHLAMCEKWADLQQFVPPERDDA